MAFEKGQSGNPGGRKKGVQNRTTKELREMLQYILSNNFRYTQIAKDLRALTPKYRLDFYLKLMEHLLPKPTEDIENELPHEKYSKFVQNIIDKMEIYGSKK